MKTLCAFGRLCRTKSKRKIRKETKANEITKVKWFLVAKNAINFACCRLFSQIIMMIILFFFCLLRAHSFHTPNSLTSLVNEIASFQNHNYYNFQFSRFEIEPKWIFHWNECEGEHNGKMTETKEQQNVKSKTEMNTFVIVVTNSTNAHNKTRIKLILFLNDMTQITYS